MKKNSKNEWKQVALNTKARISLARAIYCEADIYLLDDPLSAVDPDVAEKLYQRCIEGALKDKWVMLATHQVQHLKNVPKILLLDNHTIKGEGTYYGLKDHGMDFDKILKEYDNNDKSDEIFGDSDGEEEVEEESKEENVLKLPPIYNNKANLEIKDEEEFDGIVLKLIFRWKNNNKNRLKTSWYFWAKRSRQEHKDD